MRTLTVLLALGVLSSSAQAQVLENGTITVTGHGTATAVPDVAEVQFSLSVVEGTADSAVAEVAARSQAVLDAVNKLGLGEVEFVTRAFTVQPGRRDQRTNMPIEHQVRNDFTLRIHATDSLSAVLHAALSVPDVAVNGLSFDVHDKQDLSHRALDAALEDGRRTAETIAQKLGVHLGPLLAASSADERVSVGVPLALARFVPTAMAQVRTPVRLDNAVATATVTLRFKVESAGGA